MKLFLVKEQGRCLRTTLLWAENEEEVQKKVVTFSNHDWDWDMEDSKLQQIIEIKDESIPT